MHAVFKNPQNTAKHSYFIEIGINIRKGSFAQNSTVCILRSNKDNLVFHNFGSPYLLGV